MSTDSQILALLIIVVGGSIGLLFVFLWEIKRNWKKPRVKWHRNIILILIGAFAFGGLKGIASVIVEKHKTDREIHNTIEFRQNVHRAEQIGVLIAQSADLKDCDNKIKRGEFKTNVEAYFCRKPYIIKIFKQVGVRHENSLEAISNKFLEIATKRDKGESISQDDLGRYLLDVLRRDDSEP